MGEEDRGLVFNLLDRIRKFGKRDGELHYKIRETPFKHVKSADNVSNAGASVNRCSLKIFPQEDGFAYLQYN